MKRLLCLLTALTACQSTSQTVTFLTEPEGATVRIVDFGDYISPVAVDLPKDRSYDVEVSKPGYKSKSVHIRSGLVQDPVPDGQEELAHEWDQEERYELSTDEIYVRLKEVI